MEDVVADDRGAVRRKHVKRRPADHRLNSRSAYTYNKIDKCRGLRRKADRHSHHRRRKINREELGRHGTEAVPLASSTTRQKRKGFYNSLPQPMSNRKGSGQARPRETNTARATCGTGMPGRRSG